MTEKEYRDILFDIVAPHKGLEIVSKKLFRDGHFEAALGEASKFLENYIQDKIEDKSKTGVELMSLAFNKEKPLLSLYEGSLDAKQKNEQDGFHALCRGEVQFIKNRCSHNKTGSIASDMNDCLRLLGTINYLLDCVDKMYSDKQEEDIDFDDIPF